jgi:hypothetical protein
LPKNSKFDCLFSIDSLEKESQIDILNAIKNKNPNKKIVAPSNWFIPSKSLIDLYPKNWIII